MGILDAPGRPLYAARRGWPFVTVAVNRAVHRSVYNQQNPCAWYDATANKTFLAYLGPGRTLYATYLDHATGAWADRVLVEAYPIDSEDDHGAPVMVIDASGYLHIVFGAHGGLFRYAKSTAPRSIAAWTTRNLSEIPGGTYPPMAVMADGSIAMIYRTGSSHGSTYPNHEFGQIVRSTDGGSTFVEQVAGGIINLNAYSADAAEDFYISDLVAVGTKLYFAFIVAHGAGHDGIRSDIFVGYYDTADSKVHTVAGTQLTTPVATQADILAMRVVAQNYTMAPKLIVNSANDIAVAYNRYNSGAAKISVSVAHWNGTTWSSVDVGGSNHLYHGIAFRKNSDGLYELFCVDGRTDETPTKDTADETTAFVTAGADLAMFTSTDLATWTGRKIMTRHEVKGVGLGTMQVPQNARESCKLLFQPQGVSKATASSRAGNLSSNSVPIYALGEQDFDLLQNTPRLSPSIPTWEWAGDSIAVASVTNVTPTTTYATVGLSAYIPKGASMVRLRITASGAGGAVTGVGAMRFRMSNTNHERDADASWRAEDNRSEPRYVDLPVGDARAIDWRVTDASKFAASSVSFQILGWQLG